MEILGPSYILSDIQTRRLLLLFDTYGNPKKMEHRLRTVAYFVKYDLTNYVGRMRRLKTMNAAPNRYASYLRYGRNFANHFSVERKVANLPNVKQHWINKGFSEEDAIEEVRKSQVKSGMIAAEKLRGNSQYSSRSVDYWLRQGLDIIEAKEQVRRVQSRNNHAERNVRWQNTLNAKSSEEKALMNLKKSHTVEGVMARGFSKDEATVISNQYWQKRNRFSKISNDFFQKLDDVLDYQDTYFQSKNYEREFNGKRVDFYHTHTGIAIEFYGDYWHCNPTKYPNTFKRYGLYACDIRDYDAKRLSTIRQSDEVTDVYIVWESEYRYYPEDTISLVAQYINEESKCILKKQ